MSGYEGMHKRFRIFLSLILLLSMLMSISQFAGASENLIMGAGFISDLAPRIEQAVMDGAVAHSLKFAVVTSDNVLQDPDQSFSPEDGFSNPHSFSLSGTVHFRIAIPPQATESDADLNIYVYDPTGALVAQSTSGGTNELIDIPLPMDGTWTVWIHGLSTPGGDSDYDLFTWAISATPGRNLNLQSAPVSAKIDSTGMIIEIF